jgi:DNA-binding beta-propeller fold protein YncE
MDRIWLAALLLVGVLLSFALLPGGKSQIKEPPVLAVVDYTSDNPEKPDGLALVDLNPHSKSFGKILQRYSLGPGVSPHHLYYNHDGSKLYTTALGGVQLYRVELDNQRIKTASPIETGSCQVGEDLYFTEDGSKFYMTCMGSHEVAVFDAATDQLLSKITAESASNAPYIKYPHGISVNEAIDRILVTETVSPDLKDAGASLTAIELSSGNVLKTYPISKDGKGGTAPVEVFFLPGKPIVYTTVMNEGSLWVGAWDEAAKDFSFHLADDLTARGQGVPLEMYLGPEEKLYVSFGLPGGVNVYDLADPLKPSLLKTLSAGAGAHHIVFHGDYMIVQNNLLNLPKLNAGTISIVHWKTGKLVATVDSFVKEGLKPASLVLLGQPDHHGAPTTASSHTSQPTTQTPAQGFTLHIDAKKHINDFPNFVVHHYCKTIDKNIIQCLLFDSDEPNAHTIGTETIISPEVYAKLPEEEQLYWHHHKEEIPLVDAQLPGLSEEEIKKVVSAIEDTYGKVIIFWNPGDIAPLDEPSVTEPASH